MLFDLQGRRKRVIQVVYAGLALLMGGGLVFLGIGGDAQGGLGSLFGVDGSGNNTNPQFQERIDEAEAKLVEDPGNENALITIAQQRIAAGLTSREQSEQGFFITTPEAAAEFELAAEAWEEYLAGKPENPDSGLARQMIQAYVGIVEASGDEIVAVEEALDGASEAAQIAAEADKTYGAYRDLVLYATFAGDTKLAEQTVADAKSLTEEERKQLEQDLEGAKAQAEAFQAQLEAGGTDTEDLGPLGGDPALGGEAEDGSAPAPEPKPNNGSSNGK
jgi:hypothetical protein